MSALSDALNAANVNGWSSREIARRSGDKINHATIANYLRGQHAARPSDDVLEAFAEVFPSLNLQELRRLAGSPVGEGQPYTPPVEANRLDARQRKAVDELIRAMVSAEPLIMTPDEKADWDASRQAGSDISARDWLADRQASIEENREWLEGGGWRVVDGRFDDDIRAEAEALGMPVNDYVNGFPQTWEQYKVLRDSEVVKYVNELIAHARGDIRKAMEENNLRFLEQDMSPTLFKAAAERLSERFATNPRRLKVVRDAQPVAEAADHDEE